MRLSHPGILFLTLSLLLPKGVAAGDPVGDAVTARERGVPTIGAVSFEGNRAFSDRRLRQVIASVPSTFLRRSPFEPEVLRKDRASLEVYYHDNGFLQAVVTGHSVRADSVTGRVDIRIEIFEGEPTLVEGVTVFGNRAFHDDVLLEKTGIRRGGRFRRNRMQTATVSLLRHYAGGGFLEAEVSSEVRLLEESRRAIIDFTVTENRRFRTGGIILDGLGKTHPEVVMRELEFGSGEAIDYSRILETRRRLYLTGLFSSVSIQPLDPGDRGSTMRDVLVRLEERESGEFSLSAGFGSVEKVRGRIEVSDTNLGGWGRQASLAGRISFVDRGIEASFTEPWTLGTRWRSDVVISSEYEEKPGFDLDRVGGRITAGRTFHLRLRTVVTYRHERVTFREVRVSDSSETSGRFVRSLKLSLIRDSRNNLFSPSGGSYLEMSNEVGGSFGRVDDRFLRSILLVKRFVPLSFSAVLATALEAGWMTAVGGLSWIPLNERFYTGGPRSLRGFEYRRVGPLDPDRLPTGGRLKLVWNVLEIRRGMYRMMDGVGFFEAGGVWAAPGNFGLDGIRPAAGLGIRLNTALGIARLDYGVNLDRRAGEPSGVAYLSMGHAF